MWDRDMDILINDPRFMMMSPNYKNSPADWQRGVLLGQDHWTRAEAFIAKRTCGEIDHAFPL
jgi:hypothetical protein